ncbi:hypothetical protein L0128_01300 [candidate division KSB1 bacterium]|nr:hypothetical protein [candidate division KSB1 bacterium]
MRIETMLKHYYRNRLQQLPELPAPELPVRLPTPSLPTWHALNWDALAGWLVMGLVVVHFLFLGKFFDLFQFLPGLTLVP